MVNCDNNLVQQGWQCPICKRVYSPTTFMCFYCGGESKTFATTTTPGSATVTINPYTIIADRKSDVFE